MSASLRGEPLPCGVGAVRKDFGIHIPESGEPALCGVKQLLRAGGRLDHPGSTWADLPALDVATAKHAQRKRALIGVLRPSQPVASEN
jgi:hypothetical protein